MQEDEFVKFVDIPSQYADVTVNILTGIEATIKSGAFVSGKALAEFEENLARFIGTKFAVGCSDGTAALKLALLAAGIQPGEEVIVPTNSYIASANAVVHAGGRPVLVDCDSKTFLIDLNQVEDHLKHGKAKFVMPVHLYGNPCPMNELIKMCEKYSARIIEDNAQAIGARYKGRRTGSFGLAAGISFYPAKNLGAFGQGGALLTNDGNLANLARAYSEQGHGSGPTKYHHDIIGYNDRLHSIQAFVLNIMLEKLEGFNSARLQAADSYAEILPVERLQVRTQEAVHVYHLFEYCCDDREHRDAVAEAMTKNEIGFGYHYPVPIHKQKAYPDFNHIQLPVAERLAETLISLPMHPYLTYDQIKRVCETVSNV